MRSRVTVTLLVLTIAIVVAAARAADAHPLHTTITEIVHDRSRATLTFTVRVFANDFRSALPTAIKSEWQKEADNYLRRSVVLRDLRNNAVPVTSCGIREMADVFLICLRAEGIADVRGLSISNVLLFEKFADQISIVRVASGNRTQTFILGARTRMAVVR